MVLNLRCNFWLHFTIAKKILNEQKRENLKSFIFKSFIYCINLRKKIDALLYHRLKQKKQFKPNSLPKKENIYRTFLLKELKWG